MSKHQSNDRGRQGHNRPRRQYNNRRRNQNFDKNTRFQREARPAREVKLSFWQRFINFFFKSKKSAKPVDNTRIESTKPSPRQAKPEGTHPRRSQQRIPVSSGRLYVGNLSYEASESDLEDLFKGFGNVKSVEIIYNPRTHKSKGYAFVEMQSTEDANKAVSVLNDQHFMGRKLTVSGANERNQRQDNEQQDEQNEDRQD